MIALLERFLDAWIPRAFRERPDGVAPWFYDYFAELAEAGGRKRYARALSADLHLARVDVSGAVVVDAGSGFGVTLACLAALGARRALGVEAFAPMARSAEVLSSRYASDLPVHCVRGSVHRFPLPSRAVDFVYCNEALSHFLDPDAFLAETARILRPGGRFMICDGNNAANPATVAEVHEVWKAFEEGPGHRELHGHRIEVPYRRQRQTMIGEALPGLAEEVSERLAWGTFGLHGGAVVEKARGDLAGGRLPERPPAVDACPVDPVKGDHIENLIDPAALRSRLGELGFSVRVHAHFGGARSPWIAAANRVLRALTPVTLRHARSVKVVAVRR